MVSGLFVAPPVGLEPKMAGDIPRKIPFFLNQNLALYLFWLKILFIRCCG